MKLTSLMTTTLAVILLAACTPTLVVPTPEPATATPVVSPSIPPTTDTIQVPSATPSPTQSPSPEASPTPLPSATATAAAVVCTDGPSFAYDRARMVETTIRIRDVSDERVLAAMESVWRHCFVREEDLHYAYADHPLPIGYGQTISQPYIVALMTELLALDPDDKVLEIGTGSGYQAAVLSGLVAEVYTVEIVEPLAASATERLAALGYENVTVKHADGYYGWPEHAPFDAIIVTAAPDHVPPPLVNQLKDGGRLVIPVGPQGGFQVLWQITRQGSQVQAKEITGVRFVPLTGEH